MCYPCRDTHTPYTPLGKQHLSLFRSRLNSDLWCKLKTRAFLFCLSHIHPHPVSLDTEAAKEEQRLGMGPTSQTLAGLRGPSNLFCSHPMTFPLATVLKPEGQQPGVLIWLDADPEWPLLSFLKGRKKRIRREKRKSTDPACTSSSRSRLGVRCTGLSCSWV